MAAVNADVEDPSGIYVNTALTRSIKVGDLAAYVEDKKRNNGFQKEFAVSVFFKTNMALIVYDVD